jgi:Ca2+-binding EF-hand superfamily protein
MLLKNILIVSVLTVLPVSVYATDVNSTQQKKFSSLDMNHDGYISHEEAAVDKNLTKNWAAADSNEDGKLEASEFSAFEEVKAPESDTTTKAKPATKAVE